MYIRQTTIASSLIMGIVLLFEKVNCRAVYIEGGVTPTEGIHFEFMQRLANPCRIQRQEQLPEASSESDTISSTRIQDTLNRLLFYQSMALAVDQGLQKLEFLLNQNPTLPTCNDIKLDSLSSTPSLDNFDEEQLFKEIYTIGISLAAHLHIMGLDRQFSSVGTNDLGDEDLDEHSGLPSWQILQCDDESASFISNLEDVTIQIENILCTLVSSANLEQRASFRDPFNQLRNTAITRYDSSCTALQIRDCLVFQETQNALTLMSLKYNRLLNETETNRRMEISQRLDLANYADNDI